MALAVNPSKQDRKEREARAVEWKGLRRNFLYSQVDLASALKCSRRTIISIEGGKEVIRPNVKLLRRFAALKLKLEAQMRSMRRTKVA